jgi:sirohydrochlorin cobaltochelatase
MTFNMGEGDMKIMIVLAMHGAPSLDFPKDELKEFMNLYGQMHHVPEHVLEKIKPRYDELEAKMRSWPRSEENDPFYAGSVQMAQNLRSISGYDVIIGYNEFCSPTIKEAISQAQGNSPDKIIVLTPMMTHGGEHAQIDIPYAIKQAQQIYPEIPIVYAWPFEYSDVAQFLLSQINRYI